MINDDCFKPLRGKSAAVVDWFFQEFQNLHWEHRYGFEISNDIPPDVWRKEPCIDLIDQMFPILGMSVLKISPNHCYKWHTDIDRGVAINMLLAGRDSSSCFFGKDDDDGLQCRILKLDYQPHTFYLFNTQRPHMVLNFEKDRYLASVKFRQDLHQLTYQGLVEYAKQQNLLDNGTASG